MDPEVNLRADRHIPVAKPDLSHGEDRAVAECIKRGWISQGPVVAAFEQAFAASHNKDHGVACNSGTSALKLALTCARIGPGDKVVIPTLTMVAVANAVLYVGATPVFVDSEISEYGNMDAVKTIEACERHHARAVIVPHLYGVPANKLNHVLGNWNARQCNANRVVVIEDCAECHYATDDCGSPIGCHSDYACFSFYANKIITSGEGGMVLTNDEDAASRMRSLRSHAFSPNQHFMHQGLAYGDRMTDLQAAVGLRQHECHIEMLRNREAIARWYCNGLSGPGSAYSASANAPNVPMPVGMFVFGRAWWVLPLLMNDENQRDHARTRLAACGIETRTYFVPMHKQPHLAKYATGEYPVAEDLAARGLYLPLWSGMTEGDVKYVTSTLWNNMTGGSHDG